MAPGRISQSPTYLDVVCTTVALVPYQWPRPLSKYSKGRVLFRNSVLLLRVAVFFLPRRCRGRIVFRRQARTSLQQHHACRHFPVVYFCCVPLVELARAHMRIPICTNEHRAGPRRSTRSRCIPRPDSTRLWIPRPDSTRRCRQSRSSLHGRCRRGCSAHRPGPASR